MKINTGQRLFVTIVAWVIASALSATVAAKQCSVPKISSTTLLQVINDQKPNKIRLKAFSQGKADDAFVTLTQSGKSGSWQINDVPVRAISDCGFNVAQCSDKLLSASKGKSVKLQAPYPGTYKLSFTPTLDGKQCAPKQVITLDVTRTTGAAPRLVVFGASLSDDGSGFGAILGDTSGIPKQLGQKGQQSNGATWPVFMAKKLNMTLTNFAVAGSQVLQDTEVCSYPSPPKPVCVTIPSVQSQVDEYIRTINTTRIPKTDVVVFQLGGNDLLSLKEGSTGVDEVIKDLPNKLAGIAKLVINAGAKHVVFTTIPDPATYPGFKSGGILEALSTQTVDAVNFFISQLVSTEVEKPDTIVGTIISIFQGVKEFFGYEVAPTAKDLQAFAAKKGASLYVVDLGVITEELVDEFDGKSYETEVGCLSTVPLSYWLSNPVCNTVGGCPEVRFEITKMCSSYKKWLFYDEVHYTSTMHKAIGNSVAESFIEADVDFYKT